MIVVFLFGLAEQQRENDRELRKAGRDIERERRKLEAEEKKLVSMTGPIDEFSEIFLYAEKTRVLPMLAAAEWRCLYELPLSRITQFHHTLHGCA